MSPRAEHIVVQWFVPVLLIVLVPIAVTLYLNNQQRDASCKATITALDGITETAKAGIRNVVPFSELSGYGFTGEQLRFAIAQRKSTIEENERRLAVIERMQQAIDELKASDFCQ